MRQECKEEQSGLCANCHLLTGYCGLLCTLLLPSYDFGADVLLGSVMCWSRDVKLNWSKDEIQTSRKPSRARTSRSRYHESCGARRTGMSWMIASQNPFHLRQLSVQIASA
eukprot:3455467-Amphidinium_carterae.2